MNNKGFTLIELILSIVLITVIIIPVFAIVLNFRARQQIASDKAQMLEYKNTLTYDIQNKILTKELTDFKEMTSCSSGSYSKCYELTFKDNSKTTININAKEVEFDSKKYKIVVSDAAIDFKLVLLKANNNYIHFEIPIQYGINDIEPINYTIIIDAKITS